MTPDLQREFAGLTVQARTLLRNIPESGSYHHIFSTWAFPSFSPSYRWTIYSPKASTKEKKPFACLSVWRSDLDLEKFRSPVERLRFPKDVVPTVEEEVVWLAENEVEELVSRVRGVSIPIFVDVRCVGCDGTCFEFRYDELFYGVTLHWWEQHPAEWRSFTEAVRGVDQLLQLRRKEPNQAAQTTPGLTFDVGQNIDEPTRKSI